MCKHCLRFKVIYRFSKCVAVKFRDIAFHVFFYNIAKMKNSFSYIFKAKVVL